MRILIFLAIHFVVQHCTEFHDYELVEEDMVSGFIAGDYVIGALFPVHFIFDDDDFQCNTINEYDGIQAVEAAFFAIDMINSNEDILPNITLGIDIKDYCNSIEVVTLQTKKLVDKSISRSNTTKDIFSYTQKEIRSPLIGIIGPDSSILSIEVQSILKFFGIVQIGYSEPITDFVDDKMTFYPYFMTIVPGNTFMTEGIIQILETFNWTYVSLIHSTDSFGLSGLKHFQKLASQRRICIADVVEAEIMFRIDIDDRPAMLNIMPSYEQVDVIVCYCTSSYINRFLEYVRQIDDTNKKFVVIGGDGWPPRRSNRRGYEDMAVGELSISLKQTYIKAFDDYYFTRNLQNNKRNPWFEEFWENRFKCVVTSKDNPEYPMCSGEEKLEENYEQNPKVPYIIKSIHVLAHALHDMLTDGCRDPHQGTLPMQNTFYKSCFKNHVQSTKFNFFGEEFKFEFERIPANIKYNIHNFQQLPDGTYDYVQVGEFTGTESGWGRKKEELRLHRTLQFPGNKTVIKSTCNEPCSPKHAKVLKKDKCCWDCVLCKPLEILINSTYCSVCNHGFMSNDNKTGCVSIPVKYMEWTDIQILISLSFSVLSILLISFAIFVFVKYQNTPVVKSSTRELCYVMFAGMLLANVNSFIVVASPNTITCAAIRILPAMSFTMMYASLLVKTNRIARILAISKKKFPNLNARFLSLKAQVIITAILIGIEAIICVLSLHSNQPLPNIVYKEKNNTYYGEEICPLNKDIIIDTFSYISILLLICAYYAAKTRNLPDNFNETRHIGFAIYATILTDIAFGMIYFGGDVQILTVNLCASIDSLVILIFIFSPKLYVILRTPEKNNRIYFKTSTHIRSYIGNEKRSNEEQKSIRDNRFNGDSVSLETTTTEISIARL